MTIATCILQNIYFLFHRRNKDMKLYCMFFFPVRWEWGRVLGHLENSAVLVQFGEVKEIYTKTAFY